MLQALGSLHVASLVGAFPHRSNALMLLTGEKLATDHVPKGLAKQPLSNGLKLSVVAETPRDESERGAPEAPVLLTFAVLLSNGSPAEALTADDIAGTFSKVQGVSQQVTGAAGTAYGTTKLFLEQLFTFLKPAVDASVPYVKKATDAAVQVVAPIASDVATKADEALKNAGVDTKPVVEATKTAVMVAGETAQQTSKVLEGVKPVAANTVESLLALDPLILCGGAGALVLLYLIAPSLLSSIAYAARGYKGDLSAPQTLDLLAKENYVLIDVRPEKDKSKSGVPSLPRNAKNNFLSLPVEELPSKLKSQLRNARKVEAEVTALKISYLKRVNKSSKLVILDSYGDIGKVIAKSLTGLGFKNTWVVNDGFDGGKGWVQSRLGTDSYNTSIAEVLSPSRIIPASTQRLLKTTSSDVIDLAPRFGKLLPGGSDE